MIEILIEDFFANPDRASEITRVDKQLIRRFSYILQWFTSGKTTNLDDLEKCTWNSTTIRTLYIRKPQIFIAKYFCVLKFQKFPLLFKVFKESF